MILGQSAATAAAIALDDGIPVQDVPYAKLRERLLADGQVLESAAPPRPMDRKLSLDPKKLKGVVIDDAQAKLTGEWAHSVSVGPFVSKGYRHDGDAGKGTRSATFEASLEPGQYDVRLAYTANPNRSPSVPVTIHHAGGEKTVHVDQRKAPADGAFVGLGTYRFDGKGAVVVTNEGTKGHVIIDAVQFLPVK